MCSSPSDTWEIGAEKCSAGKSFFSTLIFRVFFFVFAFLYIFRLLPHETSAHGILLIHCLLVVVVLKRSRIIYRAVMENCHIAFEYLTQLACNYVKVWWHHNVSSCCGTHMEKSSWMVEKTVWPFRILGYSCHEICHAEQLNSLLYYCSRVY